MSERDGRRRERKLGWNPLKPGSRPPRPEPSSGQVYRWGDVGPPAVDGAIGAEQSVRVGDLFPAEPSGAPIARDLSVTQSPRLGSNRVAELRRKAGLTVTELAGAAYVAPGVIERAEAESYRPPEASRLAIAEALGASETEAFAGDPVPDTGDRA